VSNLTRADWEQRAQQLKVEGRAFIDGEYTQAVSGARFECISPVDGRHLADVASCDVEDAQRAVGSARAAFDGGLWSRLAPAKRKATMIRFAGLLDQHAEELALLETLDMGKPIGDSLNIDVPGAANALRWSGEAIDKLYDEVAATPHDQLGLVTREPVGVVAAIVPWNFPLMMACWKLGPALSTGNSVVLKPSEKSPLTAIRIAQLAIEAGIPKGVLNVLPGYGHTVGKALALHMDVDTVVFTGSSRIAKQLMIYAGESNMKRVWLEAGGKSPNIVFADAPDLQAAAESAASAIAFNQGEVCTAGSRLLVEGSIKQRFLPMVLEALKAWKPGHPLDPQTTVGALVDTQQMNTVLSYIEAGATGRRYALGRRQADFRGERRHLRRTDDFRRGRQCHAYRPGGNLRAGVVGDQLRRRRGSHPHRQRYALRPGGGGLDRGPVQGPPHRQGIAGRQRVGQPVRWWRHDRALRWLQAVGQRSRQVVACLRQIHRAEGHLDQAVTGRP
jgi:4-guanidinobutyraldehyde dehydrogenase/NAD-dependent aldehyde dehydrogenase